MSPCYNANLLPFETLVPQNTQGKSTIKENILLHHEKV